MDIYTQGYQLRPGRFLENEIFVRLYVNAFVRLGTKVLNSKQLFDKYLQLFPWMDFRVSLPQTRRPYGRLSEVVNQFN